MKSAVAILTYNRLPCLRTILASFKSTETPMAIFEDAGHADDTRKFLSTGDATGTWDHELVAQRHTGLRLNTECFLAKHNAGVAGNSNRAIFWFMRSNYDHLVLCNDDLILKEELVKIYAEAHEKTGVGLFCWDPGYDATQDGRFEVNGVKLRAVNGMGGKILSFTRKMVEKIGYFDTRFGKFGEEHCDYNIRARVAGFLKVNQQDLHCVDTVHGHAVVQDVVSSVGANRERLLAEAEKIMQKTMSEYAFTSPYRPYLLHRPPQFIGTAGGKGISAKALTSYGLAESQEASLPIPWG